MMAGQHETQLTHPDSLGLHRQEQVDQDRIGGDFLALYVKVMFRRGNAVIAMLVEVPRLLGEIGVHPLVKIRAPARHPSAYLSLVADARQVKYSDFHLVTS